MPRGDLFPEIGPFQTGYLPVDPAARISGVTHDSRQVRVGDLYCALTGKLAHGADFLPLALDVARQARQHLAVFALFLLEALALADLLGGNGGKLGGFGERFLAQ